MTKQTSSSLTLTFPSERELVMTRVLNAPRELVFVAMTQPEHVRHWYGLREHTMTVCEIDLRVGGRWRFVTQMEGGSEFAFSGVYQEITPPERVVFTEGFEALPGHDYVVTSTFTEEDGKTTLTNHILYQSQADRDGHVGSGMEAGANVSYDRLAEHLARMTANVTTNIEEREIVIERFFAAPRDLVWKTFTEPAHLTHWWAPHGWTLPVCTLDLRPGGVWQWCMRSAENEEHWGKAIYREIVVNERLVYTEMFVDEAGNPVEAMPVLSNTLAFVEHEGGTQLINHTQLASVAEFETLMEMGGVDWTVDLWSRLADYLART